MKLVLISDTHGHTPKLPEGDILIHAGDLTMSGYLNELRNQADWLKSVRPNYSAIIAIAGNHDFCFEDIRKKEAKRLMSDAGVIYLEDEWVLLDELKIYGSPQTPWFYNWAFNVNRGEAIRKYWDKIPHDTDVLITHGPPYGIW